MTKEELEAAINLDNLWSGRSTLVLAIGILGEYVLLPLLKEGGHKTAKIAFAVLVVAGVVGEYEFSSLISQHAEDLQRISDKELADAAKEAASAIERAATAESTARGFDSKIAEAQRDTAQARRDADGAKERVAKADERAAGNEKEAASLRKDAEGLRKIAEDERLARVKIEEQIADRVFTQEQRSKFEAVLAGRPKFPIEFESAAGEPVRYANQIIEAFPGWPIGIQGLGMTFIKLGGQPSPPGVIVIEFSDAANAATFANALVLREAFKAAGIETVGAPFQGRKEDELSIFVPLKK